jgi:hypothetical protein
MFLNYLSLFLLGWIGTESTVTEATEWSVAPSLDGDDCGAVGGMNEWQGKPRYWEET